MDTNEDSKAYVRFNMAYIYAQQNKYLASLAGFDDLIDHYPNFEKIDLVCFYKAELLLRMKKYYEAANFLNHFIEKHPFYPHLKQFQSLLIKAYLHLGDRLRAYELMQQTGEMKNELLMLGLGCLIILLVLFIFLGIIKWFFRKKWSTNRKKIFFYGHNLNGS